MFLKSGLSKTLLIYLSEDLGNQWTKIELGIGRVRGAFQVGIKQLENGSRTGYVILRRPSIWFFREIRNGSGVYQISGVVDHLD